MISSEVPLIKCVVNDIPVDISLNTSNALASVCFFEEADMLFGHDHIFKRSFLIIKAWAQGESGILGSSQYLLSSYALQAMTFYILNFHCNLASYSTSKNDTTIDTLDKTMLEPFDVFRQFLKVFSSIDLSSYGLTLCGLIPLSKLRYAPSFHAKDLDNGASLLKYDTASLSSELDINTIFLSKSMTSDASQPTSPKLAWTNASAESSDPIFSSLPPHWKWQYYVYPSNEEVSRDTPTPFLSASQIQSLVLKYTPTATKRQSTDPVSSRPTFQNRGMTEKTSTPGILHSTTSNSSIPASTSISELYSTKSYFLQPEAEVLDSDPIPQANSGENATYLADTMSMSVEFPPSLENRSTQVAEIGEYNGQQLILWPCPLKQTLSCREPIIVDPINSSNNIARSVATINIPFLFRSISQAYSHILSLESLVKDIIFSIVRDEHKAFWRTRKLTSLEPSSLPESSSFLSLAHTFQHFMKPTDKVLLFGQFFASTITTYDTIPSDWIQRREMLRKSIPSIPETTSSEGSLAQDPNVPIEHQNLDSPNQELSNPPPPQEDAGQDHTSSSQSPITQDTLQQLLIFYSHIFSLTMSHVRKRDHEAPTLPQSHESPSLTSISAENSDQKSSHTSNNIISAPSTPLIETSIEQSIPTLPLNTKDLIIQQLNKPFPMDGFHRQTTKNPKDHATKVSSTVKLDKKDKKEKKDPKKLASSATSPSLISNIAQLQVQLQKVREYVRQYAEKDIEKALITRENPKKTNIHTKPCSTRQTFKDTTKKDFITETNSSHEHYNKSHRGAKDNRNPSSGPASVLKKSHSSTNVNKNFHELDVTTKKKHQYSQEQMTKKEKKDVEKHYISKIQHASQKIHAIAAATNITTTKYVFHYDIDKP